MAAAYDWERDQIIDCKKNTLTWWHENRHRQQFKAIKFLPIIFSESFTLFFFSLIMFSQQWFWAGIPFSIYVAIEIDAWLWGVIEWKEWKKQQSIK